MTPFDSRVEKPTDPLQPGSSPNQTGQRAVAVTALHQSEDPDLWFHLRVFPIKSTSVAILFGAIDFSLEAKAHKQC